MLIAVSILVPVAWVVFASLKENHEFYENPWKLPSGLNFQNFRDAWDSAHMGSYFLNSVIVTALSLLILLITAMRQRHFPLPYIFYRGIFHLCRENTRNLPTLTGHPIFGQWLS